MKYTNVKSEDRLLTTHLKTAWFRLLTAAQGLALVRSLRRGLLVRNTLNRSRPAT